MTHPKKNIELALKMLANISGISLESGWKKDIAEFFGVPQNYVSKWIERQKLPKSRRDYAVKKGFPLEQWYSLAEPYPEPRETIGLPPQDDARNPTGGPSYAVTPDHLEGKAVTVLFSSTTLEVSPDHKPVIEKVVAILQSGEVDTAEALKMNVDQFWWKIQQKRQYQALLSDHSELKTTIGLMKKRQDDLEMLLNLEKKEAPGCAGPVNHAENE